MPVLNDTTVRRARPRRAKYEITCAAVRGFALRVLPSGKKVYLVRHRPNGRDVRVRIGDADVMSCEEARLQAAELLGLRRPAQPVAREPEPAPRQEPAPAPRPRARPRLEVPTFAAFARRYDSDHIARNLKPGTARRYRDALRLQLIPAFGRLRLDELTPAAVETYHATLSATPCTANNSIRVLSHMYTKARHWGVLPREYARPTYTVRLFRERTRERFLTPDERARVEDILQRGEAIPPGRDGTIRWATAAAIRLLALTGMRRSEVLSLTWSMVDERHRCLRLPDSKTGQKIVPVSSHVLDLLDELRVHQRPEIPYVLYSCHGRSIHPSTLGQSWKTIRKRAGLEDVRLHDLRHSAASDALMSGVPIEVVSKILGHASVSTTARYAHLSDHVVKAAVERMGETIVAAQRVGRGRGRRGRASGARGS